MSEFVLRPAHLRAGKFIPNRGDAQVELDWSAMVARLSPARTRKGLLILRSVRPGMFIGTRKRGDTVTTFSFDAAGRSRNAAQVLKQDPAFEGSIVEVFHVDNVSWDMRLQELGA